MAGVVSGISEIENVTKEGQDCAEESGDTRSSTESAGVRSMDNQMPLSVTDNTHKEDTDGCLSTSEGEEDGIRINENRIASLVECSVGVPRDTRMSSLAPVAEESKQGRVQHAILISKGNLNNQVFGNGYLQRFLEQKHFQLYNSHAHQGKRAFVSQSVFDSLGSFVFYKKMNTHICIPTSGVTLHSLLQGGYIVEENERATICEYLQRQFRRIRRKISTSNGSESGAAVALRRSVRFTSDVAHSVSPAGSRSLPAGIQFVAACHGMKWSVDDSYTARNFSSELKFATFANGVLPIITSIRTASRKAGQVKLAPGLGYDNLHDEPGFMAAFAKSDENDLSPASNARIVAEELKARAAGLGYEVESREMYPSLLVTRDGAPPQKAHTDWRDSDNYLYCPSKDLPLALIFPTSSEGCYLQVWPSGSGYGRILHVALGEILFFTPRLVHAGGLGNGCPRVQAYMVDPGTKGRVRGTHYSRNGMEYSDFCWSCVEKKVTK